MSILGFDILSLIQIECIMGALEVLQEVPFGYIRTTTNIALKRLNTLMLSYVHVQICLCVVFLIAPLITAMKLVDIVMSELMIA